MCQICSQFNPFQPDFLHPEGADLEDGIATTARLRAGQSLTSDLDVGDQDWVRLEVEIGQSYTIETSNGPGESSKDTLLILYDREGNEVAQNDDGGPGFHAELTFEAKDTVYFAAVTTYQTYFGFPVTDSGSYQLTLTSENDRPDGGPLELPVLTNTEIARQLTHGYWEDTGRDARGFDVRAGGSDAIYVNTSALAPEGRWFAERALEAWSDVTGLVFSHAAPPPGTPLGIRFDDEVSGAYASTTVREDGRTANVFVNISKNWIAGDEFDHNTYALQTYIHEIGHALGLGHAGVYNVGEGLSINYSAHAEFANDSWQTTVMSYFSQVENSTVDADKAYVLTPMVADVLAMRTLYGTTELRTGDTVYGEGSTAGGHYDNLTKLWDQMAFTIVDDGGRDLLNLRSDTHGSRVDLRPQTFSDLGEATGNMSIAKGTWIENVTLGSGQDQVIGNRKANVVRLGEADDTATGRGGNDLLRGEQGDDTLEGNAGRDRLFGGTGHDQLQGGRGNDRLFGGQDADRMDGQLGNDTLVGGEGRDVFIFRPGGGRDVIRDFSLEDDRLDLRSWDFDDASDVLDRLNAAEHGTHLVFGGGPRLFLRGIDPEDIEAGHLIL